MNTIALSNGCSMNQLKIICKSYNFTEQTITAFLTVWQRYAGALTKTLLSRTLASNKLIDMDWSFGVTTASDECDQVGRTYLQVKMTLLSIDKTVRDVFFELSVEQFYTFLAELENCKSILEVISS